MFRVLPATGGTGSPLPRSWWARELHAGHSPAVAAGAAAGCAAEGVNPDGLAALLGLRGPSLSGPCLSLSERLSCHSSRQEPILLLSAARSGSGGGGTGHARRGALMAARQKQMERMAADSGGPAHIDPPGPAAPGGTDAGAAFVRTSRDGGSDKGPPVAGLACAQPTSTSPRRWPRLTPSTGRSPRCRMRGTQESARGGWRGGAGGPVRGAGRCCPTCVGGCREL